MSAKRSDDTIASNTDAEIVSTLRHDGAVDRGGGYQHIIYYSFDIILTSELGLRPLVF